MHPRLSSPFLHCVRQRRWPALMLRRPPAGHLHMSLPMVDPGQGHVAIHPRDIWAALSARPQGNGAAKQISSPRHLCTQSLRRLQVSLAHTLVAAARLCRSTCTTRRGPRALTSNCTAQKVQLSALVRRGLCTCGAPHWRPQAPEMVEGGSLQQGPDAQHPGCE